MSKEVKTVTCQYCAAQGIKTQAEEQKQPALIETNTRFGCDNGHYFAMPTKEVK